ncbi:PREDICTED: uncharacterized protein LOC108354849, partial [Rhagoletis zephyria]|uniref:uncharacterized protein LOC108354849 n=1 Tax=Rhagoletis zephyria TaxID=28612 RepID=UPI00081184E9
MSQNNPFCQKLFSDSKTIPILIEHLRESPVVARSSLHALSSLINNFELGLQEFLKADGINALLCCLCKSDSKLMLRACFLIGKLGQREDLRDGMVEKSAIVQLVRCLPMTFDKYDINVETALYALCELLKSDKWKIDNGQAEKLKVLTGGIVRNKLAYPEDEEIYGYASEILQRINDHLAKIKQY